MKAQIHPHYRPIKVTCASCQTVYETRSVRGDFTVDVCAACHPFYTGKQKVIDAEGRVERFRKKYAKKA